MKINRTWVWLGGALVVASGVLALGVPLGTVLTIVVLLACPAAMFLGMGMMGRMQGGCATERPASLRKLPRADTVGPAELPVVPNTEASGEHPRGQESADGREREDPIGVLKLRLAKGDIPPEEYERLATMISEPQSAPRRE